ncbi:MAG TPA: Hpt domain-containing protein [Caulobacteraceae bacterium]|nr:Hpt domain-containing protein [Caulobacteraceae bacterium]
MGEASKAVDFGYLEGFTGGDLGLMREIFKVFSEEAHRWARELADGPSDWGAIVHTIKGTGRSVGARALGDLCEKAEADGPALLPRVQASLDEVIVEVDAWLALNGG